MRMALMACVLAVWGCVWANAGEAAAVPPEPAPDNVQLSRMLSILESRVAALEGQRAPEVASPHSSLRNEVEDLQMRVTQMEGRISDLEREVDNLSIDVHY